MRGPTLPSLPKVLPGDIDIHARMAPDFATAFSESVSIEVYRSKRNISSVDIARPYENILWGVIGGGNDRMLMNDDEIVGQVRMEIAARGAQYLRITDYSNRNIASHIIVLHTSSAQIIYRSYDGFKMRYRKYQKGDPWSGPWRGAKEAASWPGGIAHYAERDGAFMLFVDQQERYCSLPWDPIVPRSALPCVAMVCEFDDSLERDRYLRDGVGVRVT